MESENLSVWQETYQIKEHAAYISLQTLPVLIFFYFYVKPSSTCYHVKKVFKITKLNTGSYFWHKIQVAQFSENDGYLSANTLVP